MSDRHDEEVEIRTGLKAGENGSQLGSSDSGPGTGTLGSGH